MSYPQFRLHRNLSFFNVKYRTKLGEKQAINLGNRLRNELYPMSGGGGILRLHSTFRHDLKIKTSDEGRVMKTAASFAKGMLELEGDIPPILVSLVHKEKTSGVSKRCYQIYLTLKPLTALFQLYFGCYVQVTCWIPVETKK